MAQIREAICAPGDELRVVYIVGQGGLGKSRLLAEIRAAAAGDAQAGARPDLIWPHAGQVKVSAVLDLEPVRLSTTIRFLEDLVNVLDPQGESFAGFRAAYLKHRQALVFQSSYDRIQSVLYEALRTFKEDYLKITEQRRVVWLLDTGEKFVIPIPQDFDDAAAAILDESRRQQGRRADTPIYTHDWLYKLLATDAGSLKNTTVIMAGRPSGDWWNIFGGLAAAQVQRIDLPALSVAEVADYFEQLTADLAHTEGYTTGERAYAIRRLKQFAVADNAWIIWAYTGGQPVRLALLAELIIDAIEEPLQLDQSLDEVQDTLHTAQQALGAMFVRTLFDSSATLRAQILTRLLRSHHPLDAETLEYLIDSRPDEHYAEWLKKGQSNPQSLAAIRQELEWLKKLAFFKHRYAIYGEEGQARLQVYLQDVVYEILDDFFANANERGREREIDLRVEIYNKLIEVLNSHIEQCQTGLHKVWVEERRNLEIKLQSQSIYSASGSELLQLGFPNPAYVPLSKRNHASRTELRNWLEESLLDKLYYLLRIAPITALNDTYSELADSAWLEHDEDFMTQIEIQIWRLLRDANARKLVRITAKGAWAPDEDPWVRLERVAHQDHALRWLKRLHLRGRYEEVAAMADHIRHYAQQLPLASPAHHSWNHTLTRQETYVYEGYAHAYIGQTQNAADKLDTAVEKLEDLLFLGHPERDERPFVKDGKPLHDGADRVRRVIGLANFTLGYAYAAQGNFKAAHEAYSKALPYLRETRFRSLEVYCRFNMARALAELGFTMEAAQNCGDALTLLTKEGKGGTLPFALASNTLALVFNADRRLEDAWPAAVIAHACFDRMNEERGMALAALQFGESLRRLADELHRQPYLPNPDTPRHMYEQSETVLRSVYESFTTHPTLRQEELRRVEAAIELASSLRDQVRILKPEESVIARKMLQEAHSLFKVAQQGAGQISHALLELDARWGLATLVYRASRTGLGWYRDDQSGAIDLAVLVQQFENVAAWAGTAGLVAPGSVISPDNPTPTPVGSQARALRRVARIHGRLGRIYAEEFRKLYNLRRELHGLIQFVNVSEAERRRIHEELMQDEPMPRQEDAREQQRPRLPDYLQQMAKHYVLAFAYAQMYNPDAVLRDYLFTDLYDNIKEFNGVTMAEFTRRRQVAEERYHVHSFQYVQRESVQEMLERSFGSFQPSEQQPRA
jgi:tetratricopeptide (TPR) repeat protein